jgi:ABC-2 type transport system ATP-binding protein
LTNRAQIFADVRTYWSPDAVQRVTGQKLTGDAAPGLLHLINSGAAALDGCGRQLRNGRPAMKPFWEITPREALDLFGSYYPKRRGTDELLELVQLKDKADAYHVTLSGGQAQRLALALALVNNPEVVFLDEPTAGLDPQGRRSLWEVVRRMKAEGRTTMLTTHYMDEAEALCDRLAILDHGKILRSGTPAELIAGLGIPSVVELTFDGAAPDPSAFAARLGDAVSIEARGDVWEIPTRDPKTLLPRLITTIESQSLEYSQVHVRRATLEDVFLHLTGRSLRE